MEIEIHEMLRVHAAQNNIILEKSFGMFSDDKLSSERFMQEKEIEKELEG
jgi:hypothetical protein